MIGKVALEFLVEFEVDFAGACAGAGLRGRTSAAGQLRAAAGRADKGR